MNEKQTPALNRRQFFASSTALGVGAVASGPGVVQAQLQAQLLVQAQALPGAPAAPPASAPSSVARNPQVLHWLDGIPPPLHTGVAWGLPWPRGQVQKLQAFALRDAQGAAHPLQTWPLAWWPDGSVKWTGHAIPPAVRPGAGWQVQPLPAGQAAATTPGPQLRVEESADAVTVDTGLIRCVVPRRGPVLVASVQRGGVEILRQGLLVALTDDHAAAPAGDIDGNGKSTSAGSVHTTAWQGEVETLTIEQRGPQRAVLRLQGRQASTDRTDPSKAPAVGFLLTCGCTCTPAAKPSA